MTLKKPKTPLIPGTLPADQATALAVRMISSFNR